uniref:Uncharacterized protein n=1 Tax=Timema monikensis TaxID=170555 RepID=A0A7R9HPQ3_9NEOP|nr:unnamed protein product [Timema monikensis]
MKVTFTVFSLVRLIGCTWICSRFTKKNSTMTKDTWFITHKQDKEFPEHFLRPISSIDFIGRKVSAPNNSQDFLELKFGKGAIENPEYPEPEQLEFTHKEKVPYVKLQSDYDYFVFITRNKSLVVIVQPLQLTEYGTMGKSGGLVKTGGSRTNASSFSNFIISNCRGSTGGPFFGGLTFLRKLGDSFRQVAQPLSKEKHMIKDVKFTVGSDRAKHGAREGRPAHITHRGSQVHRRIRCAALVDIPLLDAHQEDLGIERVERYGRTAACNNFTFQEDYDGFEMRVPSGPGIGSDDRNSGITTV